MMGVLKWPAESPSKSYIYWHSDCNKRDAKKPLVQAFHNPTLSIIVYKDVR